MLKKECFLKKSILEWSWLDRLVLCSDDSYTVGHNNTSLTWILLALALTQSTKNWPILITSILNFPHFLACNACGTGLYTFYHYTLLVKWEWILKEKLQARLILTIAWNGKSQKGLAQDAVKQYQKNRDRRQLGIQEYNYILFHGCVLYKKVELTH